MRALAAMIALPAAAGMAAPGPLHFRDVTDEAGLAPAIDAIRAHGAAWGDLDGDGRPDLYAATFDTGASKPNLLFLQTGEGKFEHAAGSAAAISTRATGVVAADFDADGDLDLYVASMPAPEGTKLAEREGHPLRGCALFSNEGGGKMRDVSSGCGACPEEFGGRSAAALDFDGDGLIDLLVGEDPIPGYNGSSTSSSRLFRNEGGLQFRDVTAEAGIPRGIAGLGVAAGDVNGDTWPDIFIASQAESGNRLFVNNRDGTFREPAGARDVFAWPEAGGDDMVCGVCFGDVNGDGNLDIALGQHFDHPWIEPAPNRLYLNRGGEDGGDVRFEDVTEAAGLVPLPMKAPHLEIRDFDCDGVPDIFVSIVKFDDDGAPHPVIFRGLGGGEPGGIPKFAAPALDVNAFPTESDRAARGSGELFDKVLREKSIIYSAPAPCADFDRDGKVDIFLGSWWPERRSMLLRNETPEAGNWLAVRVEGGETKRGAVNPHGIGSRVSIYRPGTKDLVGISEIAVGFGYASGQEAIVHFGLGGDDKCDVDVVLPHGKGRITISDVEAGQVLTVDSAAAGD